MLTGAMFAFSFVLTFAIAHAAEHADTLQRVAETGEFRIGYVPDATPQRLMSALAQWPPVISVLRERQL